MGVDWTLEKEQASVAVSGWNMDKYINRGARSERTFARTKAHIIGEVHKGCPIKGTRITGPGEHACMADISAIRDRAVQVSNKAH